MLGKIKVSEWNYNIHFQLEYTYGQWGAVFVSVTYVAKMLANGVHRVEFNMSYCCSYCYWHQALQ